MDNKPSDYKRQHITCNRYMGGDLHPETAERLATTGLTVADFRRANERRQALAHLRIHKVVKSNDAWKLSLRKLEKLCRADRRTIKDALALSWQQVLTKVREAFKSPLRSKKYTEIPACGKKAIAQAAQGAVQIVDRRLREIVERCYAKGNIDVSQQQIEQYSAAAKSYRRRRDEEVAREWQEQKEREKREHRCNRGDGRAVKIKGRNYTGITRGRYNQDLRKKAIEDLKRQLRRKIEAIEAWKAQKQRANSAAYRPSTTASRIGVA